MIESMVSGTNWEPAKYRALLLLQTRQLQQDKRLFVRFDWSDLVQQTLLKVSQWSVQDKSALNLPANVGQMSAVFDGKSLISTYFLVVSARLPQYDVADPIQPSHV
jgi:hypothetical protein